MLPVNMQPRLSPSVSESHAPGTIATVDPLSALVLTFEATFVLEATTVLFTLEL
jgi:hypothetical protein